ncbi:MAG: biotin carboxylase [Parasphingorhabdus sp.]
MSDILLLAPHASYRIVPFLNTCHQLGVSTLLATADGGLSLPQNRDGILLDLTNKAGVVAAVRELHDNNKLRAIIGTDDSTMEVAARCARELGLPGNSPHSVQLTHDKLLAREALADSGLNIPEFFRIDLNKPLELAKLPAFPVVLKPRALSASRGVIRCNNRSDLEAAIIRVKRILSAEYKIPDFVCLVEKFIAGVEVAIEGLLTNGKLQVIAIFDKPDAMDGPYFEETYYVTPSRHKETTLIQIEEAARQVCYQYGLTNGPIHGEFRVNDDGIWPLELAARTIGGKCGRLLEFASGVSLEKIVIQHAIGREPKIQSIKGGAGVLMIPVPGNGVVRRVEGISAARQVNGIKQVEVDTSTGEVLKAWPEGGSYPGFIFSQAESPELAEQALREANEKIKIILAPIFATR